jgi:hypothetical protein
VSFRLSVDSASVAVAASSVRAVGHGLDGAPAGHALRQVAAALPGEELAQAAAQEAAEWAREMADLGAVFERYAAALSAAAAEQGRLDAVGAAALRRR